MRLTELKSIAFSNALFLMQKKPRTIKQFIKTDSQGAIKGLPIILLNNLHEHYPVDFSNLPSATPSIVLSYILINQEKEKDSHDNTYRTTLDT